MYLPVIPVIYLPAISVIYLPDISNNRYYLYKFFYPSDHKIMEVTKQPIHNQTRKHEKFDFKLLLVGDIMFDLLFTKDKVRNTPTVRNILLYRG